MNATSSAQRSTQSETEHRLRSVIERLMSPAETLGAESDATAPDFSKLLQIVGREIDEIVLPRSVALFSGDVPVATMIVSNRRLLELNVGGRKIVTDVDTDASPEMIASVYAQALKALSARSGPLTLRRTGRAPHAMSQGAVCSAQHLYEFGEPSGCESRLQVFLKEIHSTTCGWIFRIGNDEPVAHDPDKNLFERLATLESKARSEAASRKGLRQLNRCNPICAAFAISDTVHAMVISDSNDLLIAALPSDSATAAMAQWRDIYNRPHQPPSTELFNFGCLAFLWFQRYAPPEIALFLDHMKSLMAPKTKKSVGR